MSAPNRYPAAALSASLFFGFLELNALWAAGPGRADMRHPAGVLAQWIASLYAPAMSPLRAGSDQVELAYWLFMGGQCVLIALFTGLLWWRIRKGLVRSRRLDTALMAGQLCVAAALDSFAFHLVLAAELAALLPLRRAGCWAAVLFGVGMGVDIWMLATVRDYFNDSGLAAIFMMLTFERCLLLPGVALAWLVRQEQAGRVRLAASNAQLHATQSLLADTVRSSERMRIARDLHDAVGHHLTALNLHLDLALRQSDGRHPAALATARELGQSLLAEVRTVVSAEREESGVNLRHALELLCAGIPAPAITLRVDSGANACSPAAAHTLLCCVQEAITNAVRHAGAARLAIDIHSSATGVAARIADDGRGSGGAEEGNGLRGMRERLAAHGGTLHAGDGPVGPAATTATIAATNGPLDAAGAGYWLELTLPFAGVRP